MVETNQLLQVVTTDGDFNEAEVQNFLRSCGVMQAGRNYQIVAITGPQSSGKSTLMNKLVRRCESVGALQILRPCRSSLLGFMAACMQFGTGFSEMDALSGRQQTTRGIWMAQSPKVQSPNTLILDLEGSDGRERGEDDNSFERQSSLFALATADILLVNMWAKDVGREAGAGKPLLKTIFQVCEYCFSSGCLSPCLKFC